MEIEIKFQGAILKFLYISESLENSIFRMSIRNHAHKLMKRGFGDQNGQNLPL